MDSGSAVSLSSPPPPPAAHEYTYPDSEETPDPEDYETASDPGVNDADSSAVAGDTISPEKNALKSSPETGDHKYSSEDEGEIHDSTQQGDLIENSDSAGNSSSVVLGFGVKNDAVDAGEEEEEEKEEGKLSSGSENLIENGGSSEKSTGNEQSTNRGTGESHELEPKELEEGDSTVTVLQPKARESGVSDSASSPNQKAPEEVEPKIVESESSVAAIDEVEGEAGGNEKSLNLDEFLLSDSDVLKDNHGGAVVPADAEVEDEHYTDGAKKLASPAVDATDGKKSDTGHQLELVVEDEKKPVNLVEAGVVDEAGSKASVGEDNLLKGVAPEFDSIDSKDEIFGEDLVEGPEIVNSESFKSSADDLDQGHCSEISDSSPVEGEIAPHTAADDGDLNSAEEVETPLDISNKAVVGDENTRGATTGTTHEKCEDDKPDEVNLSEISEGRTPLSEEIGNEKVEIDSEHVSSPLHGEGEVEAETLPVIAKETVVGDDNTRGTSTKSPPQVSNTDGLDGALNQEIFEVVGSEHASGHGEDETELKLTADDGDLKSAEEEEALTIVPKETIFGDENIEEIINGSTDTCLNQEIGEDKLVPGSENASGVGDEEPAPELTADGGNLNSAEEVNTVPVITKETVVGDENIEQTTNESLPPDSDTHRLQSTSLDREIAEDELVLGSNHISHGEEPANETVVGDEILPQVPDLDQKVEPDAGEYQKSVVKDAKDEDEEEEEDGRVSDGPAGVAILHGSEAAEQIIREMERISSSPQSGLHVDGQIVSDSDEAVDSDEDGEGGELFDSTALAALLRAATGSSDGTVTVTAQDAARIFSVDRPVGLGTSAPSLRPAASRSTRPGLFTPSEIATVVETDSSMDDDEKRLHEKVEQIRVKFLRLVYRLGHSPEDSVAGQVLYRLSLAEGIRRGRQTNRAFSIENAKKRALQLEAEGKDDLNFSCNIMVIGKTGVGKSATINSIFGEERSQTNPFQLTTASVREVCGVVDGVRVRVLDTPGLKPSIMDQAANRKILSSIKKSTKKCPPDIVLYVDRMDTQTRDFNDLPLLKSITSILGSSIWFNAIVALTHAASAPPDGTNGSPLAYDVFVSQRSHVVQQSIRQAAGDMRLMNPVALVENHPSCRRNREGERVLPNGLSWRPQLLLLSYASKILSEANSLLKLQDPSPGKLFGGFRLRSPPLPFLLSSLLQARAHPKLSGDQGGDNADSDVDLDEFSDAEQDEEVDEYDQLPPFKPLRKSQIAMLTKEQKKAYFDEYDYRVKLLQKKQWKEELRRLKEAKKKGKGGPDEFPNGDMPEDYDQESGPAAVQVPLPDMVLPPSFDCDNPAFRYRFLEPTSQFLTRPVLDTHGWDHDCGYDGVNIEENLAIAGRFPTSMAIQITKDKKEFNIHLDSSVAAKHGEHGSTVAGFDIQSVGKQLAYILRGETKFDSLKKNKTAAGVSVTFLGETVATGLKVEDRISIGKRLGLVTSTGAVRAQGDVAYGANLEVRLRDKDYPIGQALSTLGLSLMKWRSDLALGANLQSQFSVGRNSKMSVRVGLNNKLTGQITVRTSTSDQFQIALAGIIPLAVHIYRTMKSNESYMDH
ncbi:hypothetical protein KSP39_PZI006361 [Platanthera zijinensis]|uniref:AIG1-type G domain-containing protein n=1 Tax=Platanthera zijinensis TaxID=2320716 RepID=A0AAP0G968_9ASPA